MADDLVTPALRQWILEQAAAGCRLPDVLAAMQASGWRDDQARVALQATFAPTAPVLPVAWQAELDAVGALPPAVPVPEPDLATSPARLWAHDRTVDVLVALQKPRLVVFGGLLDAAECDELMALAAPRMARSETVVYGSGGNEVNAARTSQGMFFGRGEHPVCARLEARIAALLRWPVAHGEGLQVLHYRPGAEYKPHHDYFDPAQPGMAGVLRRGGQRVATVVVYLNTPEAGGATVFPELGLEVAPVRGHAVFFSYERPHASTRTLHGGAPVLRGDKWVATKWLREREFT